MFAKKDDNYAIVEALPSGRLIRYISEETKEEAQVNVHSFETYCSLQDLKDNDWTLLPDLDGIMRGDLLKDKSGNTCRVLTTEGAGEYRTLMISGCGDHTAPSVSYTVAELKKDGYTLVMPEEAKERTVGDVLATLPDSDKEIVRKAMKV